jgi:hypothetical protein
VAAEATADAWIIVEEAWKTVAAAWEAAAAWESPTTTA